MLGGVRSQRNSRAGFRHAHHHQHAHAHAHAHGHPYHRQLFPGNALISSPFMTSLGGHLSPFGMSPFGGFGLGNSGLLCFGGGSGLGSNSLFSSMDGHPGGGFSSVQSFSSGFSPAMGAMRSVSTQTKFMNGKKITTKK